MNDLKKNLLQTEFREFFHSTRSLHFIPLWFLGVVAITWVHPVGSPLAPIVVIAILGLEPQFNNILYRRPNEFTALHVSPVAWPVIIYVKNLATIILLVLMMLLLSLSLLYFSPDRLELDEVRDAILYVLTIIFPLLWAGNAQSVRQPRKHTGFLMTDMLEAVWMAISLAMVSVPYFLIAALFHTPWISLVYSGIMFLRWRRGSVPKAAELAARNPEALCSAI